MCSTNSISYIYTFSNAPVPSTSNVGVVSTVGCTFCTWN
jgi:hypothetical protein